MRIAVAGNDARYTYLSEKLTAEGHCTVDASNRAELYVCGSVKHICNAPDAAVCCWCGVGRAPDGWLDIMSDEEYLLENAYLTAEGAVFAAMKALDVCIDRLSCLVVGWGRIGRSLARILCSLGARAHVSTRQSGARKRIEGDGARYVRHEDMPDMLPNVRAIFTTAPARVLSAPELSKIRKDAILIDLSGSPYAVDIDEARAFGLNAWREPALPGRYCPASAADALLSALKRGGAL